MAAKPVAVALQALWSAHPQASRVLSSSINMWYFVWLRHDICHIFYTRCLWQISCLTRVPVLDFFLNRFKAVSKGINGDHFCWHRIFLCQIWINFFTSCNIGLGGIRLLGGSQVSLGNSKLGNFSHWRHSHLPVLGLTRRGISLNTHSLSWNGKTIFSSLIS